MSTVGSASATGSIAGRTTTWASGTGSQRGQTETETEADFEDVDRERDQDQMSMDTNYRDIDERDRYSASAMDEDLDGDGMSDDTSLVGFGEGAGSTVSGPTYSRKDAFTTSSPAIRSGLAGQVLGGSVPGTPMGSATSMTVEQQRRDARMIDGLADDAPGYIDTAARGGGVARTASNRSSGLETAERILRERLDDGDGRKPALGTPDESGLGRFYFEDRK
jgi:hypothetical protein